MAKYKNITSSQLIATGGGKLYGIIVNSHTSGTIKLWDSQTAAFDVIIDTYTFPSGSSVINLNGGTNEKGGIEFYTGLFATIGGTANVTLIWMPN